MTNNFPEIKEGNRPKRNKLIGWLIICFGVSLPMAYIISHFVWGRFGSVGRNMLYLIGLAVLIVRQGNRFMKPYAKELLEQEERAPLLYLRSFSLEGMAKRTLLGMDVGRYIDWDQHSHFESQLKGALESIGPLIAFGKPGEKLEWAGAFRFYLAPNEDWQPQILKLFEVSRFVIIRLGLTTGVEWEIQSAVRYLNPEKLILAMPFYMAPQVRLWTSLADKRFKKRGIDAIARLEKLPLLISNHHKYELLRSRFSKLFPVPWPKKVDKAVFMTFDTDWNPIPLTYVMSKYDLWTKNPPDPSSDLFKREALEKTLLPHLQSLGI